MRLIDALAASAALHVAMLALPAGELSFGTAKGSAAQPEMLRAELRPAAGKPTLPPAETRAPPEKSVAQTEVPQEPAPGMAEGTPAALGIPLPHYYGPREVEVRARPVREIDLEAPAIRNIPDQGNLVLLLWINESGTVDKIDVESSAVADTLRNIIVEQFRQAAFAPAQIDGRPVKSRMKIEVVVGPPAAQVVPPPPPRPKPASAAEN